jgi:hypothetical protein
LVDDFRQAYAENYIGFDAWLRKWPPGKRAAIMNSIMRDKIKPKRGKCNVKFECGHTVPTRGRLIQFYRNLATQALHAFRMYTVQKALAAVLRWRRHIVGGVTYTVTFASGMTSKSLGGWMTAASVGRVIYLRDASNYDSTMRARHFQWKDKLNRSVSPAMAQFVRDCSSGIYTYAGRGGQLVYESRTGVKSGHNDTSSGNSLANAAIMIQALATLRIPAHIIVMGDDVVACVPPGSDASLIASEEARCGIVPKSSIVAHPEQADFLSATYMWGDGQYWLVPKPGRIIMRLFWSTKAPPPRRLAAYQRGVVLGLDPLLSTVEWWRAFTHWLDRDGPTMATDKYHHHFHVDSPPSFTMREQRRFFAMRYNMSHTQYDWVVSDLSATRPDGMFLNSRLLHLVTVDGG